MAMIRKIHSGSGSCWYPVVTLYQSTRMSLMDETTDTLALNRV